MNEMLLDQLPVLVEMQRYLEQLSMMEPPAVKKELLLEQVFTLSFFHIKTLKTVVSEKIDSRPVLLCRYPKLGKRLCEQTRGNGQKLPKNK